MAETEPNMLSEHLITRKRKAGGARAILTIALRETIERVGGKKLRLTRRHGGVNQRGRMSPRRENLIAEGGNMEV